MAATQMNARIDSELKRKGDEVFARSGYTPSQVIRAVWEYAVEHDRPPSFMTEAADAEREAELQRKLKLAHEGAGIVGRFMCEQGLSPQPVEDVDYKQLREMLYEEKLAEYEAMDRA